jgi:NADPH:quinone reductase
VRGIVNTPGGPDRVEIRAELPEPKPAPDEVVVAVEAFSPNRGELALLAARPAGWRPGQEIAGTVVVPAVDGGPPAGARVAALVEQAGWAERVAVPVDRLVELPTTISAAEATTLGMAGRTALHAVELGGSLLGRRVLVTGAAGGVGRYATQLAVGAGGDVVAVSRRSHADAALRALGAVDVVTDAAQAEGLFDVVLDVVGGAHLAGAVAKSAPSATIVLIGASDPEPAPLRLIDFIGHENVTLRTYFSYAEPHTIGRDLAVLVRLVTTGRLTPQIGLQVDWADINPALAALADGRVDGKAVLTIRPGSSA